MVQPGIEFQFHGEGRDALARELSDLLSNEFDGWPQHTTNKTIAPVGEQKSDPVAIAALIIAVPAAVLATWDLAQRIQVKQKIDRLISWAKRKESEAPETQMTIHLPGGAVVRLDQVKPESILDVLAVLAEKK